MDWVFLLSRVFVDKTQTCSYYSAIRFLCILRSNRMFDLDGNSNILQHVRI